MGAVRFDGLYLSFGAAPRMNAVEDEDAFVERGSVGSAVASGDVRAYLLFTDNGSALLGRREADGQWSQLRCRCCIVGQPRCCWQGRAKPQRVWLRSVWPLRLLAA